MKNMFVILLLLQCSVGIVSAQDVRLIPSVGHAVYFDISPPLRDMIRTAMVQDDPSWKDGVVENYFDIYGDTEKKTPGPAPEDPGLQDHFGPLLTDTTVQNFEGNPNLNSTVPPDTHGDIGYNHYFQVVNCSYSIYNKTGGKIFGPAPSSSVWTGMPHNANSGDAIVLFDENANRWIFSQFSLPNGSSTAPFYQMIAVSQTPDPAGSWYRWIYEFSDMPDYPKFGIWQDGYYMSTNNFAAGGGGWAGNGAYSYDRNAMLAGNPDALRISFTLYPGGEGFISLLPADCDGTFPLAGTPNYFTYIRNDGTQRLGIYEFHSDWVTPSNSTFGNVKYLNVTPYSYFGWGSGIPQKDSPQLLETLGDRLMYRQQYRKFNGYSSMVLNHTIGTGTGVAGIRWYELRNTGSGWVIYQQSTYAPSDNNYRWMGSIAQDTAGTISLGYSVSGQNIYPAIRYTGRFKNDPLNQMTIMEKRIINGGGSQTGVWSGRSRWGDYSAMSVDPSCPTTFWFTTEYYGTTSVSNWQTRIASFTFGNVFSSGASAYPSRICLTTPDSSQLNAYGYGGSGTYTYAWTSIPPGFNSSSPSPKVRPEQTTQYIVAVSDGNLTRHDTTEVRMVPGVVASAGNDTTVCWYLSPVPLYGTAVNYNKIMWGTGGDGRFSDVNAPVTSYYPGIHDKTSGSVDLVMLATPLPPCTQKSLTYKHIVLDPCTGIRETGPDALNVMIQPNPAHDLSAVTVTGLKQPAILIISGMDGRPVHSSKIDPAGKQSVTVQLDVSGYPGGMYMVKLQSDDKVSVTRFIVY